MKSGKLAIRHAARTDKAAIVALERGAYGSGEAECYGEDHVECWLETHPAGLVVAERSGTVVGFTYVQVMRFTLEEHWRLVTHDEVTDRGFSRATHDPCGNAFYSVSVCSSSAGASKAMFAFMVDFAGRTGKRYYAGAARMSGFDAYMTSLERQGRAFDRAETDGVAAWYARVCAEAVHGKVWPTAAAAPDLALPGPDPLDPVLCKYLKYEGLGIVAVRSGYMTDAASRDYGVIVAYDRRAV